MEIRLIVQADDFGMTHGCNLAVEDCYQNGILTCTSLMAPAPWAEEAAGIARANPGLCVGAHLTTLCEWRNYRWRPVLPYSQVKSLVDENGFLHQTPGNFFANPIDFDQLEREFMAQMDLLSNKWGVDLGYVDYHYINGKPQGIPEYNQVMQRVAAAYGLPLLGDLGFGRLPGISGAKPEDKAATFAAGIENLKPGVWRSLHHLLQDDPESHAITFFDPAVTPPGGTALHRYTETAVLKNPDIKKIIEKRGIRLVTYREL